MTAGLAATESTALRLAGRDVVALLHRVTTQFLRDLAPGACRTTLFCDFRGRVQHRVAVGCTADGAVWLVRSDAPPAELAAAIEAQIFRDRVAIEDRSAAWSVAASHGTATAADVAAVATGSLTEHDGVPERLVLPDGTILTLRARATAPPADTDGAAAETARIRAGAPRHGYEIHADWNPFEIGLAGDVHLDKGCFTGQEALLRMMTYGSVRRRLVLVEGTGAAPTERAALRGGEQDAGVITSAAPAGAGWVALAVVRREVIESGVALAIDGATALTRVAPFPEHRPAGLPAARPQG